MTSTVTPECATSVHRPLLWTVVSVLERFAALVAFIVLLPALLATLITVGVLSGRPPLVAHGRIGHRGRELWLLKIRTMWPRRRDRRLPRSWVEHLAIDTFVPVSKAFGDARVTSGFASFCRRYSIDEWPQLWQVATGTLGLVGPRPITAAELRTYYGHQASIVTQVKPGLIGLWQVRGRSRLTYGERCSLDLFLIQNWSVRLYLYVVLASIPVVLSGRNAS